MNRRMLAIVAALFCGHCCALVVLAASPPSRIASPTSVSKLRPTSSSQRQPADVAIPPAPTWEPSQPTPADGVVVEYATKGDSDQMARRTAVAPPKPPVIQAGRLSSADRELLEQYAVKGRLTTSPTPGAARPMAESPQTSQGGRFMTAKNGDGAATGGAANEALNPSDVANGEVLFTSYCTDCHDADRSLKKNKSLAAWRTTVERMSKMEDADIPETVHESISQFLAAHSATLPGRPDSNGGEKATPASGGEKKFDSALVQQGTEAFNRSCVTCHDAEKSYSVTKSLAGWLATVRRMAGKTGANIPESTHTAIATYLASRGGAAAGAGGDGDGASPLSVSGTISAMFRTSGNNDLENPGHFGDAWLGFAWQNSKSPVSGKVTTCVTCHAPGPQTGSLDLVEASLHLDINKLVCPEAADKMPVKASAEAGRFVVPFGAYYQQVNPGVDRAVSRPLIFKMGQRVRLLDIGDPVLPMPYSDEGASLTFSAPIEEATEVTFTGYTVNGLTGGVNGVDFYQSRDYVDNNRWPAGGGRLTIGGANLRLGASAMGGRFNDNAGNGPLNQGMYFFLYGVDAVFQWTDVIRVQCEFAQRDSDRFGVDPATGRFAERVSGAYAQFEWLFDRCRKLSFFSRYDSMSHHGREPVLGSQIPTGMFVVQRFTYGVNWTLPGGSLLMVNHEHWFLPRPLGPDDVFGVRWSAAF